MGVFEIDRNGYAGPKRAQKHLPQTIPLRLKLIHHKWAMVTHSPWKKKNSESMDNSQNLTAADCGPRLGRICT